jgi:hypothetical protein
MQISSVQHRRLNWRFQVGGATPMRPTGTPNPEKKKRDPKIALCLCVPDGADQSSAFAGSAFS